MRYRTLGSTKRTVSQLGFGAMRLPMKGEGNKAVVDTDRAVAMIHRAFELGVTYIDTAVMYCNDDSQRVVGEALKGWRDKITVSTKNHYFGKSEKEWWTLLEQSLERLQIDAIDIYNHHGVDRDSFRKLVLPVMSKWMMKAKDQGLIKHICCSFHDDNSALCEIVNSGYPEVITVQYNLLDRQLEHGIALAHEKGIGVIVMGPVGGGRLGSPNQVLEKMVPDIKRIPELALNFVLANPAVDIALSGMSTMEQVEENAAIVSNLHVLEEEDRATLNRQLERLKEMADLYCTGCRYCMPCPAGVDIPGVFDAYNDARIYGLWDHARHTYAGLLRPDEQQETHGADMCVECGDCTAKCPQHINIPVQLKQAHTALSKENR